MRPNLGINGYYFELRPGQLELARLSDRRDKERLWDHFVNSLADPKNDITPHVLAAPEGRVYPVKSASSDPETMSQTVKELGQWLGANLVGIAALDSSHPPPELPEGEGSSEAGGVDGQEQSFPFAVVCLVLSDYDPAESKGLGGQQAVQLGAVVSHHLRAYIRELGYRASFAGADPEAVAEAAGLGKRGQSGRFITGKKGSHAIISQVISTDLPLAPDGRLIAA